MKANRSQRSTSVLSAALATLVVAICFASPAVAEDNDSTPDPHPSSSAPDFQTQQSQSASNPDGDSDVARERKLEAKYGNDRDIATPPLIVRQSIGSSQFVTKPLHIQHLPSSDAEKIIAKPLESSAKHPIKVASGQTVVAGLQPADFESPAAQFLNFAYVFMGVLVLVLVTLAVGLTTRKDRLDR